MDPPRTGSRPRTLTLVCHLLVDQAAAGRLVGHVEVVRTGEVVAITGADQLVALVARSVD